MECRINYALNWVWNNIHLDHPHSTKGLFGKFLKVPRDFKDFFNWLLVQSLPWLLWKLFGYNLMLLLKMLLCGICLFISWEHGIIVRAAQEDDKLVFCKLRSFKSHYLIKFGYKLQWEISRCFEAKPILAMFHLSRNTAERNLVW